jgi:cob(I)alamin adenosyltransferase
MKVHEMNKQQIDQQMQYIQQELTRIGQEMTYQEGTQLQSLQVRQSRLAAELERLQAFQLTTTSATLYPNPSDSSYSLAYTS